MPKYQIPPMTVERIKEAAKIEDIVGDYVTLRKRGANLIGLCPFHDEKTGSFTVSPAKGIYKCFGCGKAGNAIGFLQEIEHCDYWTALKMVAKRYHIEVEEREMTQEEKQLQDDRESMYILNEWANGWFQNQLWETREGQAIGLSYLHERGLRDDIIRKFQLGYSPDKNLLAIEAIKHGYQKRYILNDPTTEPYIGTGLCLQSEDGRMYDRFHSRVIFPFFSLGGKIAGFAGRLMKQNDKVGKYVNSPTSPIFEKHEVLFGLYQAKSAIGRLGCCYLVEGQMDVISMVQAGIENVVASGGTSLTKYQIRNLHRFTENITVLYDGDKAGIKAAIRGIDMILEEGINVSVVLLPDGEDPDSFARSHNANELIEFINRNQTDFIRFKTRLLMDEAQDDPIKKSGLLHSVVESIAVIRDSLTRQVYIKECAHLLGYRAEILAREVNKILRNKYGKGSAPQSDEEKPIPEVPDLNENTPVENNPKPASTDNDEISKLEERYKQQFENILAFIIRYGNQPLRINGSDQNICIAEYIRQEMEVDAVVPNDPIHKKIWDEYYDLRQEGGFNAEHYFINHDDSQLCQCVINMLSDKYQISKMYLKQTVSENVTTEVVENEEAKDFSRQTTCLLMEIKLTIVQKEILKLRAEISRIQQEGDYQQAMVLLGQMQEIQRNKSIISQLINRVIIKG